MKFGFGRSFVRGFGWGLGRQAAWEATHPRPRKQKSMRRSKTPRIFSKTARVFSTNTSQPDMKVLDWINEAVQYYRLQGRTDPTFEEIQLYVKQHHKYMLTR
jgi:hypothetical protein